MKLSILNRFALLTLATSALSSVGAKPLKGQINVAGRNIAQTYFIVSVDENSVTFSSQPSGANPQTIPLSRVDGISFIEPEGWGDAQAAFTEENYELAAASFGALADDYASIAPYADSYGARARYFEMESHRRLGKVAELAAAVNKMEKSGISLDDSFSDQLSLYPAWAAAGKEDWKRLRAILEPYEEISSDENREEDAVEFKELPSAQFVQVAYLRGLLKKGTGQPAAALDDFTRALVLSFGQERAISGQAALAALEILAELPDIASDSALQGEAYALCKVYEKQFGKGKLPPRFAELAKKPE